MRIALRTSGGRGEYEVAGIHESIKVINVYDRHIILEIFPGSRFPTNNFVRHTQGKPRIRLFDQREDYHTYLILAAILLLPKPKREIGATPGGKLQVYKDNFSVMSVPFDIVELTSTELVIAPTQIILSNSSSDSVRLDVIERLRIVTACWEAAAQVNSPLATAVLQHRDAFHSKDVKAIIKATELLRFSTIEADDPLRHITRILNLPNLDELLWLGIHATDTDEAIGLGEENLEELRQAAKNRMKVWRQIALRGAAGARFSIQVREAYNHSCLFTGMKLPKITATGSSGVDAAHILPWAEYNLNSISNGLCLSKLCHWAFDAGIMLLNYNVLSASYEISLSAAALKADSEGILSLGELKNLQGTIPTSLLPKDSANWPNPSFLLVYNAASNLLSTPE